MNRLLLPLSLAISLAEDRVKSVTAGTRNVCLVRFRGQYAAMDNRCPHQGGPLGEGSIEVGVEGRCWIRCPWHGWDFDPLTGASPGGHEDAGQTLYPVEIRDGEVFVGLEPEPETPTREVVIRFDLPDDGPPPGGRLGVKSLVLKPNRHYRMPRFIPIENGEVRTRVEVPGKVKIVPMGASQ